MSFPKRTVSLHQRVKLGCNCRVSMQNRPARQSFATVSFSHGFVGLVLYVGKPETIFGNIGRLVRAPGGSVALHFCPSIRPKLGRHAACFKISSRRWSNSVSGRPSSDESYRAIYREAGLEVVQVFDPLAKGDEPYSWVSETKIAPWVVYVLRRQDSSGTFLGNPVAHMARVDGHPEGI